jgi:hypothetical protein
MLSAAVCQLNTPVKLRFTATMHPQLLGLTVNRPTDRLHPLEVTCQAGSTSCSWCTATLRQAAAGSSNLCETRQHEMQSATRPTALAARLVHVAAAANQPQTMHTQQQPGCASNSLVFSTRGYLQAKAVCQAVVQGCGSILLNIKLWKYAVLNAEQNNLHDTCFSYTTRTLLPIPLSL